MEKPKDLLPGQTTANGEAYPKLLMESSVTHAELLGIVEDGKTDAVQHTNQKPPERVKYLKRNVNVSDTDFTHCHLADNREVHMEKTKSR